MDRPLPCRHPGIITQSEHDGIQMCIPSRNLLRTWTGRYHVGIPSRYLLGIITQSKHDGIQMCIPSRNLLGTWTGRYHVGIPGRYLMGIITQSDHYGIQMCIPGTRAQATKRWHGGPARARFAIVLGPVPGTLGPHK